MASFHFGNSHGSTSMIGQVLTGFIQREIVARTPLRDCRTHGRTWDLLRLTKMPTVQIDIGYLTNESDVAVLTNPRYRDTIAEAILVAVKRLYLLGQDDQPTGTFTFAELLAEELSGQPRPRVPCPVDRESRARPMLSLLDTCWRARRCIVYGIASAVRRDVIHGQRRRFSRRSRASSTSAFHP